MKTRYKLSILLLLSMINTERVYTYQEETVGAQIIAEHEELAKIELVQKEIDDELYDLFKKFFDEHDTMPFSKFITKIITVLKIKRNLLKDHEQTTCDEIIRTFERNRYHTGFHIWAPILAAPDLRAIMSPQTRAYINSVSTQTKISALINKLRK